MPDFNGISFTQQFNIDEAKELLDAEMAELQIFVEDTYGLRRRVKGITVAPNNIWDCFGKTNGDFRKHLHFSLSLHEEYHDIALTVPNKANRRWTRLRSVFLEDYDQERLIRIIQKLRSQAPHLFIRFHQRHFIGQTKPFSDGFLEFDIDTIGTHFWSRGSSVKTFSIWFETFKNAIISYEKINKEVQFRVRYYYDEMENINTAEFIETVKLILTDFKPLYEFLNE